MPNLNLVQIMGNLTKDPELKYTPQGTAVCRMGIAVNRQYKGTDGEMKKDVQFFTVVIWGKLGETCSKYLAKGRPVYFSGRLNNRSYETQDKQKRTITEIIGEQVQFLGSPAGGHDGAQSGQQNNRPTSHQAAEDSPAPEFDPNENVPF